MSKATKQTAQVEALPPRVLVEGYAVEFYMELQRLVRLGYSMVLDGPEAPQTMMNQWSHAVLVLAETA